MKPTETHPYADYYVCDPNLHDGKDTAASWLIRKVDETDNVDPDDVDRTEPRMWASCDDHVGLALEQMIMSGERRRLLSVRKVKRG